MNQQTAMKPPIAVDLFAGAGGLTLGFEQAGFRVMVAVENDCLAAQAHRVNFPQCHVIEKDIRKVTSNTIREAANLERGSVDLVIGGPPCQGFSYAGRRDSGDPRNALTREYVRIVRGLRPKAFVMENVRGLVNMDDGAVLRFIYAALGKLYNITVPAQVLTASQFGVPQNRQRLFLIGCRKDLGRSILYPAPTHIAPGQAGYQYDPVNPWHSAAGISESGMRFCSTVFDALHDLPRVDELPHLVHGDTTEYPDVQYVSAYAQMMRSGRIGADASIPRDSWNNTVLTNCKRTLHDERITTEFNCLAQGQVHPSRRAKLKPWGVSPTIRAGTKSDKGSRTALRPIHFDQPRVITVREAARLMSFPDWVTFHETKWHGFRLVGAAVPPLLASAVARQVFASIVDSSADRR